MKVKTSVFNFGNLFCLIVLSVFLLGCAGQQSSGQTVLKTQQEIEIKGSDTMLQLVGNWAEAFSQKEPQTKISVTGGGSGTGVAALINGEVFIANSSRAIKEEEIQQAQERGITPLEFIVGIDTLSVIVHKDNPVQNLTVEQIAKIFKGEITNWNEVGGPDSQISLYGRQSTSGTYVYFQEEVLKGDYAPTMRNMEGSQAIVDAVKQDSTGIGYIGIGYAVNENGEQLSGIGIIDVAKEDGSEFVSPLDLAKQPNYPISRKLFQYVSNKVSKDSATYRFLLFELSDQGQEIVEESGFVKLLESDRQKNEEVLKTI